MEKERKECPYCDNKYADSKGVNRHIINVHKDIVHASGAMKCTNCDARYYMYNSIACIHAYANSYTSTCVYYN